MISCGTQAEIVTWEEANTNRASKTTQTPYPWHGVLQETLEEVNKRKDAVMKAELQHPEVAGFAPQVGDSLELKKTKRKLRKVNEVSSSALTKGEACYVLSGSQKQPPPLALFHEP